LVGRSVVSAFTAENETVAAFDHAALDISDESVVVSTLASESPDVVINCAAWTEPVRMAARLDKDRAHANNALGPEVARPGLPEKSALLC